MKNKKAEIYGFLDMLNHIYMVKSREKEPLKIHSVLAKGTRLGSIGENRCAVQRKGQIL
jgi:hypothetical protein